jgi:hypothetical protein
MPQIFPSSISLFVILIKAPPLFYSCFTTLFFFLLSHIFFRTLVSRPLPSFLPFLVSSLFIRQLHRFLFPDIEIPRLSEQATEITAASNWVTSLVQPLIITTIHCDQSLDCVRLRRRTIVVKCQMFYQTAAIESEITSSGHSSASCRFCCFLRHSAPAEYHGQMSEYYNQQISGTKLL